MGVLPLEGIRILDFSRYLPGPFCTMILADLGAEVIMVEEVGGGLNRRIPPMIGSESSFFLLINRNKKSITLNLRTEEGREVAYKLIERVDVLVEQFRPGVMKRLGLDYETVSKINPRIIYCSITGYGQDGPYVRYPGHDVNYLSIAGILGFTGLRGGPPVIPGVQIGDIGGGALYAVIGILAALAAREKTGRGQYVDISMTDGALSWTVYPASIYLGTGKPPERGATLLTGGLPYYNVYETKDGKYISLGLIGEPHFWRNLCKLLGREEWGELDPLGLTPEQVEEITEYFKEAFKKRTRDEWFKLLIEADVPAAPVYDLDEVFRDPQVLHRKMVVEIDHPTLGKIKQLGIPIKMSDTPGQIRTPPPLLGQHTEEILRELGYSQADIERMRRAGVI